MFCDNCGNPIESGAKFCRVCGSPVNNIGNVNNENAVENVTPVENVDASEKVVAPTEVVVAETTMLNETNNNVQDVTSNDISTHQDENNNKKGGNFTFIIITVLLLIIIGILVFFILRNKENSDKNNAVSNTTTTTTTTTTQPVTVAADTDFIIVDGVKLLIPNGYKKYGVAGDNQYIKDDVNKKAIAGISFISDTVESLSQMEEVIKQDYINKGLEYLGMETKVSKDNIKVLIFRYASNGMTYADYFLALTTGSLFFSLVNYDNVGFTTYDSDISYMISESFTTVYSDTFAPGAKTYKDISLGTITTIE